MKNIIVMIATVSCFLLMLVAVGIGDTATNGMAGMDCTQCHTCDNPTKENPCLRICPRPVMVTSVPPDQITEIVIIDALEDLYVPVRFNHQAHAKMVGMASGCVTCHHYSEQSTTIEKCQNCHPIDIKHEDIAQPGLKGAYHRQCLGCHSEWDKDTACEVCHEKKAGGKLNGTQTTFNIHSHYKKIEMKELILFPTEYEENDQVPFHHRKHAMEYEKDCTTCHKQQSCAMCHVHENELHPMGDLTQVDLHEVCWQCHDENQCESCHGGRDPNLYFTHDSTGWPLLAQHATLKCWNCHTERGPNRKLDPTCTSCHDHQWDPKNFDHRITMVELDDLHGGMDCADCHAKGFDQKSVCDSCHDDGRGYDPQKGFKPTEQTASG